MATPFSQIPACVLKKTSPRGVKHIKSQSKDKASNKKAKVLKDHDELGDLSNTPNPKKVDGKKHEFLVKITEESEPESDGRSTIIDDDDVKPISPPQPIDEEASLESIFDITKPKEKQSSDKIIQVAPELVDKSTQTENRIFAGEYETQVRAQSLSYHSSRNAPPLKLGLSRPKGASKKRRIFYPDEEPNYKPPSAPAC